MGSTVVVGSDGSKSSSSTSQTLISPSGTLKILVFNFIFLNLNCINFKISELKNLLPNF